MVEGTALAAVTYRAPPSADAFPFSVASIASLREIALDRPVTVLVGENGTGKSTFLEALAIAVSLPVVGAAPLARDPTLAAQRSLASCFRLAWRRRTRRGFFLRAEDFFGFQQALAAARAEHEAEIARVDREMADASNYARTLAKGPHRASIGAMDVRYGKDPDAASHGEAFLRLFGSRLVPEGLYLLDEPEAALSPQSQLGFLAMIKDAVDAGSQFVIATHAPILMAVPGAALYSFDGGEVAPISFEQIDSVRLVRDFLNAPERYLRHVWPSESGQE